MVEPGGEATLTFYSGAGAERIRTVTVSADREAAIAELTLVGSNLVRDQTAGLIREVSPVAALEVTRAEEPAPLATEGDSPEGDLPTLAHATVNLAQAHPLHLGVAGFLGLQVESFPSGSNVRVFGAYGLSLSGTVTEQLTVGLTRTSLSLGFSSIDGALFGIEGTPFLELFGFLDERVQVYGQLGLAIQGRSQTGLGEGVIQLAPFLGAGVRIWAADTFSVGLELGAHVVLTDSYLTIGASLPQFSVPATIGLSAEWHILP